VIRARRLNPPAAVPDREKLKRRLANLFRLIKTDVPRAREILMRHLLPSP
jgi:hypothetical protein